VICIELRTVITECRINWGYLQRPTRAEGNCSDYTWRFVMAAHERGVVVEEWTGERCAAPERENEFLGHTFAVYDGIVIDWTASQFWPSAPFPLIEPLHEYAQRWGWVGTMDQWFLQERRLLA
jgi:hypothetical protein